MKRVTRIAVLLMMVTLLCSACNLRLNPNQNAFTDMPLSGEKVGIGYHDDQGYHIVNRYEFVQPSDYEAKAIPHSYQSLTTDSQRELYNAFLEAMYCFSDKKSVFEGEYEMRPLILGGTDYGRKEAEAS